MPQVLDAYLQLLKQVESDDLVHALQSLVKKFNKQIADYTPAVMQNLVSSYFWLQQAYPF